VSAQLAAVVGALVVGGACLLAPPVVTRLPEPKLDSDRTDKVPYAELGARRGLAARLAIAGAAVGATLGWFVGPEPVLAAWLFLGAVGVVLAYVDAQTRLLPTRLIAPSYAVVAALLVLAAWLDDDWSALVRAALAWAAMGGFYFVMWFVYPKGLGYGDVRLSGLLGLCLGYLGWGELVTGMYAGFLLGGLGGALLSLLRIVDRKRYPFGPFMLLGALVGVVLGQPFGDWYTSR
jgi:leader peptidase (prepilin peptidase)/N-methyltransferase